MTVGVLADLAKVAGMPSEPTLRRLIATRPDFPMIRAGGPGAQYRLDLEAAAAFVRATWRDRRRRTEEREEELAVGRASRLLARSIAAAARGGSLAELAAMEGMPSLPSLQRFIAARPDFPAIERGRRGIPFVLDLELAAGFVRANWRDGRRLSSEAEQRLALSRDAQLALPGLDTTERGA